ncbi:MAG: serine hydrolase [Bacteroidia bacterium]|nr:serine hydrolase [Bacteroidia bacterium]
MKGKMLIYLLLLSLSFGIQQNLIAQKQKSTAEIDNYLEKVLKRSEIPGLAVAILKKDQLIYEGYFGYANLEHKVKVDNRSIFRVYSLTKPIVATAAFHMMEKGKFSLEDPISKYLKGLPNAWKKVKIKHLLSHSSGLPELGGIESPDEDEVLATTFKKEIYFPAGNRFRYTQTNFLLLKQIMEKQSDKSFEEIIYDQQFLGQQPNVLFSSNSQEVIPHRAQRYQLNYQRNTWEKIDYVNPPFAHSGNGLNLSLPAMIRWDRLLNQGKVLSENGKAKMWSEFRFDTPDRFAHGWGFYQVNGRNSLGFTGGGVAGFRKFREENISIIFLSNGAKYRVSIDGIINHLAGMVDKDLEDKGALAEDALWDAFVGENIQQAFEEHQRLKKENPQKSFEGVLNSIGYDLLGRSRHEDALEVFKLNVKEHPDAWNVYDSLGEGYEEIGEIDLALKYYRKSVQLNPDNQHGVEKIKELTTH